MHRIYLDNSTELTTKRLSKIIRFYNEHVKPDAEFNEGYYNGTGQAIMRRVQEDASKPNNKIVKNYCASIVQNFQGYLTGKPVTYSAAQPEQDITPLLEVLQDNDYENSDSEFLKNALKHGEAYQLVYINEEKQKRFRNIDKLAAFPIYDTTLDENLRYFVTYTPIVDWDNDTFIKKFAITVYDNANIYHYETDSSFVELNPTGIEPHHFGQVPVAVLTLEDGRSIFENIISLQDAYNSLLSDEVNDFEAFVDAYLVLKGVTAEEEDLAAMKESRTILIDAESEASYLTKSTTDTQIENMLANINSSIHTISNSPDFSSEEFNSGVSSGIALQFKLLGFENIASNIESQFRKALAQRIDLINEAFTMIDTAQYDIDITFTRNIPTSISDVVTMVNNLRGLVSDQTLLTQIPFVTDVAAEIERNNEALNIYDFGNE